MVNCKYAIMSKVSPHIFRAYDIRGIADDTVTEEFCTLVGKAFGSELRERYGFDKLTAGKKDAPEVIVGRDARTHSPKLEQALIEGLTSTGCSVKTIGQTPSPVNYFAVCHTKADGSAQVTASHNAGTDNGLKLQIRDAEAFSGDELQNLRKRIEEERFLEGEGSVEELDAVTPYIEKVLSVVASHKSQVAGPDDLRPETCDLKVVVDFGNGVSGPVYQSVFEEAGIEIIPLFAEPDGTFPNHIADPTKRETLTDLIASVQKEKADCGIAFDGDGDRVGFVDENGEIISADQILLLLAEDHLDRNPGASIVYTCAMSSILETEVQKLGGDPKMCIVGHSFVEHAMKEFGSHLGGEQSGHFFCGEDFYDHDDALVTALRVLSIFTGHKSAGRQITSQPATCDMGPVTFSSLFNNYPQVFLAPEWRPRCDDHKKTEVVKRITEHFQKNYPCETMDGVRIDFGDGAWAGVRQSNTSPKISICMEARSEERLDEIEKIVREHLGEYEEIG